MGTTNKLLLATIITNSILLAQTTVRTSDTKDAVIKHEQEIMQMTEIAKLKILERETENYYSRLRDEYSRRQGVKLYANDLTKLTELTSEEMTYILSDTSMVSLAPYFVEAESTYKVNAFAIAGVVALESSWNTSRRANDDNNLTGYAVYSDSSKGAQFDSKRECILATAKLLKENYLIPEGPWYRGTSIYSVNESYSSDKKWCDKIVDISAKFESKYRDKYLSEDYLSTLKILPEFR